MYQVYHCMGYSHFVARRDGAPKCTQLRERQRLPGALRCHTRQLFDLLWSRSCLQLISLTRQIMHSDVQQNIVIVEMVGHKVPAAKEEKVGER